MFLEARTKADVETRLEELSEQFGDFPIENEITTDPPELFEKAVEMAENGWRGDAGVLATDAEGRYLLIKHAGAPDNWGIPGGGHEPGETMVETARREYEEETGLTCKLEEVISARIKRIELETDRNQRLYMLTVWFKGMTEGGEIDIGDEEVLEVSWFNELPDNVFHVVEEYVAD